MALKKKSVITLDEIFDSLLYTDIKEDNIFEIPEVNKPFEEICKTFPSDLDENERLCSLLVSCIEEAERNAFKLGYKAALELILVK